DANLSLGEARDIGDAGTLLFSLFFGAITHFLCGSYATTEALANELYTLADEQGAVLWKSIGQQYRGWVLAVTGRASERSEEHTSELQSHVNLVCRLLLEKK